MKISIVIPVYNEASYLKDCLDSIAAQTLQPYEVLVVNNNSDDQTLEIAKKYGFVRIVHESQQGTVFARNAGFDLAKGEIIARIDADTRLPQDWLSNVSLLFEKQTEVAGISGSPNFYDIPGAGLADYIQPIIYQRLQRLLTGTHMLWGANMAIRREAWLQVCNQTSHRTDIDEDIDLTLCLHKQGLIISYVDFLSARASFQRGRLGLRDTANYLASWPRDYILHDMYLRAALIALLTSIGFIAGLPFMLVGSFNLGWIRDIATAVSGRRVAISPKPPVS